MIKILENVKKMSIYQQNKAILQIGDAISYFSSCLDLLYPSIFLIFALF